MDKRLRIPHKPAMPPTLNLCPECGGLVFIRDLTLTVTCRKCGRSYTPITKTHVAFAWNHPLVNPFKLQQLATQTIPHIVVLCGSTRFYDAFMKANYEETMAGNIVLSVGFFVHSEGHAHGEGVGCTPDQKLALDEMHKRKIDLADEIFVLNVGGYIGESTRSEIEYAEALDKGVRYLEPVQ